MGRRAWIAVALLLAIGAALVLRSAPVTPSGSAGARRDPVDSRPAARPAALDSTRAGADEASPGASRPARLESPAPGIGEAMPPRHDGTTVLVHAVDRFASSDATARDPANAFGRAHRSGWGRRARLAAVAWGDGYRPERGVVDRAAVWLVAHQSADGSWSASQDLPAGDERADGSRVHDVGASAIALLALLASGADPSAFEKDVLDAAAARALAFLESLQSADGRISLASWSFADHLASTVAMLEAVGVGLDPAATASARRALTAAGRVAPAERAVAEGELEASSWLALAVHELPFVRTAESVPYPPLLAADSGTVADLRRALGETSVPERAGALLLVELVRDGRALPDSEWDARIPAMLVPPPSWPASGGALDRWFVDELVLTTHCHGRRPQSYARCRDQYSVHAARLAALSSAQRVHGRVADGYGSWDPTGPQGRTYGRVGATALALLTLLASESHGPMFEE
jgi:hypothetical protein